MFTLPRVTTFEAPPHLAGVGKMLANEPFDLLIFYQPVAKVSFLSVPARNVRSRDADSKTERMNFLTHLVTPFVIRIEAFTSIPGITSQSLILFFLAQARMVSSEHPVASDTSHVSKNFLLGRYRCSRLIPPGPVLTVTIPAAVFKAPPTAATNGDPAGCREAAGQSFPCPTGTTTSAGNST